MNNLSLNEAIDVAQNRPLWRLMSGFGATRATNGEEVTCRHLSVVVCVC